IRTGGRTDGVGGTLEPGEHWCVTATRELREEAGAKLAAESPDLPLVHPFGLFRCRTDMPRPYRTHLPWSEYVRVVAWCEVEIDRLPTNPPDGEQVVAVLLVD